MSEPTKGAPRVVFKFAHKTPVKVTNMKTPIQTDKKILKNETIGGEEDRESSSGSDDGLPDWLTTGGYDYS